MLRITDYEFLCALYQSKNITQAAGRLFISQPALTKRLQQIERDLDTVIVHRNGKGVQFTPEGEYVVHYAKKCIEEYRELKRGLHGIQAASHATISIASAGSLAHFLLPSLLAEFKRLYPGIQLILRAVGSGESAQRVHNGQDDVGFVCGEQSWTFQREFIRTGFVTLISYEELNLQRLPFLPRIDPQFSADSQRIISNWWQNNYDLPPRIAMNVPSIQTCVELVKRNLGYSILMDSAAYQSEPRLHHEPLRDNRGTPLQRSDYMIYLPEAVRRAPLNQFISFARDYFERLRAQGEGTASSQ